MLCLVIVLMKDTFSAGRIQILSILLCDFVIHRRWEILYGSRSALSLTLSM